MLTDNPDFYPTPRRVVAKMLEPWTGKGLRKMQILEPSAGAGDILDYINTISEERYNHSKLKLYAIERDPELIFTLQGKGYTVIANDFLRYSGEHLFDLIIMNPPFSRGDEHLLRAWEIMRQGDIVCLLNEQTIMNPYTETRQLLARIIEDNNGTVEYLGDVFGADAKRTTDVGVVLVRLHKDQPDPRFDFNTVNLSSEPVPDFSEEIAGDQVALSDITGAMLRQYELTKSAYLDFMRAKKNLEFYSNGITNPDLKVIETAIAGFDPKDVPGSYNSFVDALKSSAWLRIINKMGVEKYLTHGVLSDFSGFKKAQGAIDLTRQNIFGLVQFLLDNRSTIMDKAVVDVFDHFTKYHKENRAHVEGWKTNDYWKVNQKVILPGWVSYGSYDKAEWLKKYGSNFKLNWSYSSEFRDIDKVMCHLTGKDYDTIRTLEYALDRHFQGIGTVKTGDPFDNEGSSEFFDFKFWKKGTLHITFRDKKLWEKFNIVACKGKNWLPEQQEA